MRAALRVFSNPALPPVGFCTISMWLALGNPVSWVHMLQFRQGSAGRGSVWGGRNDEYLNIGVGSCPPTVSHHVLSSLS